MARLCMNFEFAERDVEGTDFLTLGNITMRMGLKDDRTKRIQLPLRVRHVKQSMGTSQTQDVVAC